MEGVLLLDSIGVIVKISMEIWKNLHGGQEHGGRVGGGQVRQLVKKEGKTDGRVRVERLHSIERRRREPVQQRAPVI